MRRWALGAVVALAAAPVLPALGAAQIVGQTRLLVSPAQPHRTTNVVVRFRQPTLGGLLPAEHTSETLRVIGPTRPGCIGQVVRDVPTVEPGTAMRETLRPGRMAAGRWCLAVYRVALEISQYTTCPAGVGHRVCPQDIPLPRVVATARFRVTAAH